MRINFNYAKIKIIPLQVAKIVDYKNNFFIVIQIRKNI